LGRGRFAESVVVLFTRPGSFIHEGHRFGGAIHYNRASDGKLQLLSYYGGGSRGEVQLAGGHGGGSQEAGDVAIHICGGGHEPPLLLLVPGLGAAAAAGQQGRKAPPGILPTARCMGPPRDPDRTRGGTPQRSGTKAVPPKAIRR